ncbi:MAG TPA: tripartite tricarboxylate transporter substrate binding protein [Paralcaligenes sp.]
MNTKKILRLLIAGAAVGLLPLGAHAEDWPSRPITFVVPFSPGGAIDLISRVFAKQMGTDLKQSIIVENRPGAGGVVGSAHVARSKADGYTFLVAGNGIVTNSQIRSDQPYKDDQLTPIAMLGVAPSIIITSPSNPAHSLKDFVENAKKNHVNRITFSRAGVGSTPDFVGAMVKLETGLPVEPISYKSGSEDVTAVMSGQVDMTSEASIVTLPLIKAGKVKALATTWGGVLASAPNIPTTAQEGFPNLRIGHWEGLFAPAGTPNAILDAMNAAVLRAAKMPDVLNVLEKSSVEPGSYTRPEFVQFTEGERTRLGKVVRQAHMRAE